MEKILSIAPYAILPYTSGGQKLIAQFNEYLGAVSELTVVSTIENEISLATNYTMLPWMKKGLTKFFDTSLFVRIKEYVNENNITNIITEHPYMGWLGFALKKSCNVQWIVHTHNIEFERFRVLGKKWWPVLKAYETWVLRKADKIFCISEEDMNYMIGKLKLDAAKCFLMPFGVTQQDLPTDKKDCRQQLEQLHGIKQNEQIILFNGVLGYKPNLDALKAILYHINPLLLQQNSLQYKIIICGKNLPADMNELKAFADKNIIYTGFVKDIELYFKGADMFLNPVILGGGVKTKLIEAIGFNTTVISTTSGAIGCDTSTCKDKLIIVKDEDWQAFANAVIIKIQQPVGTPIAFYEKYFWGNIIQRAVKVLAD